MYKSKLQELCHKKSWRLPEFGSVKDGPDHQARFKGTVIVNGATFESPLQYSSSKEAQNVAARIAFNHFSGIPDAPQHPGHPISVVQQHASPPGSSASVEAAKSGEVEQNRQHGLLFSEIPAKNGEDLLHTYKNRLQIHAQKNNLILPAYSYETFGPPHHRLYKSKVTVNGMSFETPKFCSTLKDAEHGAAKVAYESMSLHLTQEDEVGYKTLLQELAQRKGHHFPTYKTDKSGPSHMQVFVSIVEIGGKSFRGQEAKTKKMAEMNAAKAAYNCLTECQKSQSFNPSIGETSDVSSFSLQPDVTRKADEDVARKSNISSKEEAREIRDSNGKRRINSATPEDAHAREQGSSTAKSPPQDPKDGASLPIVDIIVPPAQKSFKRIVVSPRTPNMIIPEDATILPTSTDRWVAMTMDVPLEEYETY